MACGVPFISTNVGIVPDAAGKLQREYILEERSVRSLKAKLIQLMSQQNAFLELSSENLIQIKDWDWNIRAKEFEKLWSNI
jgi:glycosyltransferase involved in cell wall biosynthesis